MLIIIIDFLRLFEIIGFLSSYKEPVSKKEKGESKFREIWFKYRKPCREDVMHLITMSYQ